MNRFQFGDSDGSVSDFDEDPSGLPFPEPLSRTSFLAPDFDPATFLSSLTNRHQSLEDLRQELRGLEQFLNKELLDLVNENYQDFLSLGSALRGGEEKVEGVKVGVLSFQRDVKAIRDKVEARRQEVEELLNEKRRLRTNADVGKDLLDYADRVEELEHRLMIEDKSLQEDAPDESDTESDLYSGESEDSDDDELADGTPAISLKRMERHAQKFVYLTSIAARVGEKHPFLLAQQPRVAKIKSTVLLDLKSALEQATAAGSKQGKRDARTMAVLRLYDLMGEDVSAVAALKNLKL
ncbi:COG complex component COG2 [Penicillium samsonianum]|uniref:COG complex component COG2 n=1 Tax=Penicillium samsonianum TaxID=1882272 RepID=UPI00254859FA|nr:COG complex component COG2 [Penicillium samsonianum]KAJ6131885.1 COG complex component COG2 [Penicillium samsonianum]